MGGGFPGVLTLHQACVDNGNQAGRGQWVQALENRVQTLLFPENQALGEGFQVARPAEPGSDSRGLAPPTPRLPAAMKRRGLPHTSLALGLLRNSFLELFLGAFVWPCHIHTAVHVWPCPVCRWGTKEWAA